MVFFVPQVGVIGNLVHSSPNIKKEVLLAGALQPVIGLLRYNLSLDLENHSDLFTPSQTLPSICNGVIISLKFLFFLATHILLKRISIY